MANVLARITGVKVRGCHPVDIAPVSKVDKRHHYLNQVLYGLFKINRIIRNNLNCRIKTCSMCSETVSCSA